MIVTLPATDHDHLADALVRDLGFKRSHVDQPLRDLLLELDPYIDAGSTLANMGPTPRLSSRLELVGGWGPLLNPPRSGAVPDRMATEVKRLLEVLRGRGLGAPATLEGDVVVVGVTSVTAGERQRYSNTPSGASGIQFVALADRFLDEGAGVNRWLDPAGVVGEQAAVVAYVQELRQPRPTGVVREVTVIDELADPPADDALSATLNLIENAHATLENDPA